MIEGDRSEAVDLRVQEILHNLHPELRENVVSNLGGGPGLRGRARSMVMAKWIADGLYAEQDFEARRAEMIALCEAAVEAVLDACMLAERGE